MIGVKRRQRISRPYLDESFPIYALAWPYLGGYPADDRGQNQDSVSIAAATLSA